ncbi:MAG TPA: hypothetical protein VG842_08715 [Sediminibacterium sp.]|nr:hypothetical protein [Sediminibacterium sp.]
MQLLFQKARTTVCLLLLSVTSCQSQSGPSIAQFKQVFNQQLQALRPDGFSQRVVKFVQVQAGKPNGGYYPFLVTAYVYDYGAGYPANHYYGETCLGKMDGWKFDMLKDDFGKWIIQGRFTITSESRQCKQNASAGTAAIALADVPGTTVDAKEIQAATRESAKGVDNPAPQLYIGEYASYGSGGRLLIGMGFILLQNGKYYNLDHQEGGSYQFDPKKGTIRFTGGFLGGQTGTHVTNRGFDLSGTIHCEPWRS